MERRFLGKTTSEIRLLNQQEWNKWFSSMVRETGYTPGPIPAFKLCWCCQRYNTHHENCQNPWDVGHWIPDHKEVLFYGWEPRIWWPLSNFYTGHKIVIDGREYPTSEHYFQAAKAGTVEEREKIREAPNPNMAKFLGKQVVLSPNWETTKYELMKRALRAKFSLPDLKNTLLGTGARVIHEESPKDYEWGNGKGKGRDLLGKALMDVREELVAEMFQQGLELVLLAVK